MEIPFLAMPLVQTRFLKIAFLAMDSIVFSKQDHVSVISLQGTPLIAQRSGRFKTAHTSFYLSARAYRAVRLFVTALYGALS